MDAQRKYAIAGGTTMFNQLLPRHADNAYRGHKLALWLFAVVLFVKGSQSVVSIFRGYSTLTVTDGIPLDRYTTAGAQTRVSMFAILGFTQFLIAWNLHKLNGDIAVHFSRTEEA